MKHDIILNPKNDKMVDFVINFVVTPSQCIKLKSLSKTLKLIIHGCKSQRVQC